MFLAVRYGKLECNKDPSYNWWKKVVKKVFSKIGAEDEYYSRHSPREGGATDLLVRLQGSLLHHCLKDG